MLDASSDAESLGRGARRRRARRRAPPPRPSPPRPPRPTPPPRPSYSVGSAKTRCSSGTSITSASECKSAATSLGHYLDSSGSWKGELELCFVDSGAVYFNSYKSSTTLSSQRPICKGSSSPSPRPSPRPSPSPGGNCRNVPKPCVDKWMRKPCGSDCVDAYGQCCIEKKPVCMSKYGFPCDCNCNKSSCKDAWGQRCVWK